MLDVLVFKTLKKHIKPEDTRQRSCQYKGISRNGSMYQVLVMIDGEKFYLSQTSDSRMAALVYDYALIQAKGMFTRVNFDKTRAALLASLFSRSVVEVKRKSKNSYQ